MIQDIRMGDPRLPELHGRGHRPEGVRPDQRLHRHAKANATGCEDPGRRQCDDVGYFVEPTLIETKDPSYRTDVRGDLRPVVTACTSTTTRSGRDARARDRTSPYALTGAVFAQDRPRCVEATRSSGTPRATSTSTTSRTGAVVGQQPFGGARASGTNDKAGSKLNLLRWVSAHDQGDLRATRSEEGQDLHAGQGDAVRRASDDRHRGGARALRGGAPRRAWPLHLRDGRGRGAGGCARGVARPAPGRNSRWRSSPRWARTRRRSTRSPTSSRSSPPT
jgi:hypothetical protein